MKCLYCAKEHKQSKNSTGKYCSAQCQQDWQHEAKIKKYLNGEIAGWTGKTRQLSQTVRRWLFETRGTACSLCGWDEKHPIDGKPLTEVDHIDGDAENCAPDNLQILCPNCHSMTPTFRARNRNSKRER